MKRSELKADQDKVRAFQQRGRESSERSLRKSARETFRTDRPKPLKRSQPDRDWTDARLKIRDACCRLCPDTRVEAAHVIGREHDRPKHENTKTLWVNPDAVIPLCRAHHTAYDHHELDVLPVLTLAEQLQAVADAEGIENARVRTCPSEYDRSVLVGRTG